MILIHHISFLTDPRIRNKHSSLVVFVSQVGLWMVLA